MEISALIITTHPICQVKAAEFVLLDHSALSSVIGSTMRRSSSSHEPKSISLQRSLQKGNVGISLIQS